MLLGEFFNCVWLVLLALNLMTTFPSCFYCSSYSTSTYLSSPSSSSSVSSSGSSLSESEQNSATAAISANSLCHHSIYTSKLISANCQQIEQKEQKPKMWITGEISEGPGPPSCPPPCSTDKERSESTRSEKNSSCYRYLVQKDCVDSGQNDWSSIRLRHCCEHSVQEAIPNSPASLSDQSQCEHNVKHLLELDAFVAKVTCQFEQVLLRFDCQQNYSVSNCQKCKDAYRRWVCASLIPHWRERHKIKPCRSICHAVEQNCPWFLPADKNPGYPAQYAGEPIFQCIDANIPETGEQLRRSTYGNDCCYDYCEQRDHSNTLNAGYHHSINSRILFPQTISCIKGCNFSNIDPSQSAKSGLSVSCNRPSVSSSTSSTTASSSNKKNVNNFPFVNFPLSSCTSSESSAAFHENSQSKSIAAKFASNTIINLSSLITCLIFCLFYTNMKLNSSR